MPRHVKFHKFGRQASPSHKIHKTGKIVSSLSNRETSYLSVLIPSGRAQGASSSHEIRKAELNLFFLTKG
jgi:hypothetical protein